MESALASILLAGVIGVQSAKPIGSKVDRVVGTYKQCLIGCVIVTIRPDHTFSYQPMSDVGEPVVVEGRWEFEADNILVANTFDQPERFPITSTVESNEVGVTVRVLNLKGVPLPTATVKLSTEHGVLTQETDEHGIARFPRCEPSYIQAKSGFSQYTNSVALFDLSSLKGNSFEVKIPDSSYFITNEKWLVQGGRLWFIRSEPLIRKN